MLEAYAADGLLDGSRTSLGRPLPRPGLLIGGRYSHVIGEAELARAADGWGVERVKMSESGHFPYVEEPEAFAAMVAEAAEAFSGRR